MSKYIDNAIMNLAAEIMEAKAGQHEDLIERLNSVDNPDYNNDRVEQINFLTDERESILSAIELIRKLEECW